MSLQKRSPGNKSDKNDRKDWRRWCKKCIKIGKKFSKHELESSVRNRDDLVNGANYKRLPNRACCDWLP